MQKKYRTFLGARVSVKAGRKTFQSQGVIKKLS